MFTERLAIKMAENLEIIRLKEMLSTTQKSYDTICAAIERSGLDISACGKCGELVVCIPDGLPLCEPCAKGAAS